MGDYSEAKTDLRLLAPRKPESRTLGVGSSDSLENDAAPHTQKTKTLIFLLRAVLYGVF